LGALTIAQDKASSVIHGMPGEAIRLGGVSHILSLDEIASFIVRSVAESTSK
jgi:two-component system chemotaxis response regulator CheB